MEGNTPRECQHARCQIDRFDMTRKGAKNCALIFTYLLAAEASFP